MLFEEGSTDRGLMAIGHRGVEFALLKGQPAKLQEAEAGERVIVLTGHEKRLLQLARGLGNLVRRGIGQPELQLNPGLRPVIVWTGTAGKGFQQLSRERIVLAHRPH